MPSILTLLATFALASVNASASLTTDGDAVLEGTYNDVSGAPWTYAVTLEADGTISDTESRSGTYSLAMDPTGNRVLTLDFGRLGIHTLYEGPSNCWEEVQPPANPNLIELAICLAPYEPGHRIVHYDVDGCSDYGNSPIYHTGAVYPQESGHWMAGRLTSDAAGGFWVHDFTYVLNVDYDVAPYYCAPVDHKAQLFMGPANASPPASPTVQYEANVSGAALTNVGGYAEVTIDLPNPLFVPAGQSVFVSVEAVDDGVEEVCPAMCGSTPPLEDHTYWSDAADAPYSWYDLEPFSGFHDMMVQAHGIAAN